MAAQRGRDILIRIADGAGFSAVAGLRTKRFALDAQTVDVTDSQSAGRWRELLGEAGVRTLTVTGAGLFKDRASDELVRAAFFEGAARNWQLVVPDFGTLTGAFVIARLEYAGEHDGEATFQMTLESAGPVAFEARA